jgi:hypothetical protein
MVTQFGQKHGFWSLRQGGSQDTLQDGRSATLPITTNVPLIVPFQHGIHVLAIVGPLRERIIARSGTRASLELIWFQNTLWSGRTVALLEDS